MSGAILRVAVRGRGGVPRGVDFKLPLPPGRLLKGRLAGAALAGEGLAGGSVWMEWLRLSAVNLGVMFFVIVAPNVFRSGDYPYGYATVTLLAVILGITFGTDSSAMSAGGKLAPSAKIFARSGLHEIIAYVLAAAATVSISKYRLMRTGEHTKININPKAKTCPRALPLRSKALPISGSALLAECGSS
jgi:hypothetical protein